MPFLRERSRRWSPVKSRCLRGVDRAGALDRLPSRDRRSRRPAGHRGHPPGRRLGPAISVHHAGDHAGTAHPPLSPHHSGEAHIGRRIGGLRPPASFALHPRPAFRSVQSGKRDRPAHLSADRRARVDGADRAGLDLDRRRHQPVWARHAGICCTAWCTASPCSGAVHFFIQSKLNIYQPVLMAGISGLAAGISRFVPALRRGDPACASPSRRCGGRGDRGRRSAHLHVHERRRLAARAAGPFRPRRGGAAGLVGACRRPCSRRARRRAAEARTSAREPPPDLAQRHVGGDPGPIRQLMAEPGGLALGVAPGVALSLLGGLRQIDLAFE